MHSLLMKSQETTIEDLMSELKRLTKLREDLISEFNNCAQCADLPAK